MKMIGEVRFFPPRRQGSPHRPRCACARLALFGAPACERLKTAVLRVFDPGSRGARSSSPFIDHVLAPSDVAVVALA